MKAYVNNLTSAKELGSLSSIVLGGKKGRRENLLQRVRQYGKADPFEVGVHTSPPTEVTLQSPVLSSTQEKMGSVYSRLGFFPDACNEKEEARKL